MTETHVRTRCETILIVFGLAKSETRCYPKWLSLKSLIPREPEISACQEKLQKLEKACAFYRRFKSIMQLLGQLFHPVPKPKKPQNYREKKLKMNI